MNFGNVVHLAKEHPLATGVIVISGGVLLLVVTGVIGGKSSAASGSANTGAAPPDDAQVAASASVQNTQTVAAQNLGLAGIQEQEYGLAAGVSNNQTAAAQTVALSGNDDSLQALLAQYTATQAIDTAQIQGTVQQAQIAEDTQNHVVDALTGLITALHTPPTAAPVSSSAPVASAAPAPAPTNDNTTPAYNLSNPAAPVLQGFNTSIENELDTGQATIVGNVLSIAGQGSTVLTNPQDTQWENYVPGSEDLSHISATVLPGAYAA